MKYQVIYFSRKGSTKKLADAISSQLGVKPEDVKKAKLDQNAFIFLGSGCYGGKPSKVMKKFIENNDFKKINVALFGTSGGGEGKEVEEMQDQLNKKEAKIKGKFFCKAKFAFMNLERPNNEDLDKAKKFAKNMIN